MNGELFDSTETEDLDLYDSGEDIDDDYYGEDDVDPFDLGEEYGVEQYYGEELESAEARRSRRGSRRRRLMKRFRRQQELRGIRREMRRKRFTSRKPKRSVVRVANNAKLQAKKAELQTKVLADVSRSAYSAQAKRIKGTENALVASIVVSGLKDQFGKSEFFKNKYVKTLAPFVPLWIFLNRPAKATDISHPLVWGSGAIIAALVFNEIRDSKKGGTTDKIDIPLGKAQSITQGVPQRLIALALDDQSKVIIGKPLDFNSSDLTTVRVIDPNGTLLGVKTGSATITVTDLDTGKTESVKVTVVAP